MAKRQKRSERVGISLTPTQHQHLQAIAAEEDHNPSSYVYELVCQSLETHPSMARNEVSDTSDWGEQLVELYGIFDGLTQQLEDQADQAESDLLQQLSGQIESVQKMLHSLHRLQAK